MAYTSPYRDNISVEKNVLTLSAKNEQGKRANWTVKVSGNKVRLTVWSGIDGDVDNGKIALVLDPEQWYQVMSLLEYTIQNRRDDAYVNMVEIKAIGREGYKAGPKPTGDIYIGRDKEGVIFISMVIFNRPKIKFNFEDGYWYQYKKKDGGEWSKVDASELVAKAYLTRANHIISTLLVTDYVDKEQRERIGGNRKGGNNKSTYNNNDDFSGGSSSSSDSDTYDDDIGF